MHITDHSIDYLIDHLIEQLIDHLIDHHMRSPHENEVHRVTRANNKR